MGWVGWNSPKHPTSVVSLASNTHGGFTLGTIPLRRNTHKKKSTWRSSNGTFGVVRSYHPLEQIRFSWHADGDAPKSLVDLHLMKQGDDATVVEIRHEHIPGGWDTDAITQHWEDALDRIADAS